jgi:two-component system, OmpR family, KDP operon response regulator KdpE
VSANAIRQSVLVCDGDLQTVRALRSLLRDAGLDVRVTQTAEDALSQVKLQVPDAVILEMTLVDSTGAAVSQRLREWSSMPIIILSSVSDENRVVDAFRAGADDYIVKPFRPSELVARVHAHLQRAGVPGDDPVIVCGELQVDLATRVVHRAGQQIRLTPIEYKLLGALVRNRGRLLTHNALLQNAWGAAYANDRQTLRAHMANLRRKLRSPTSTGPIRTYPGVGYLFDASANPSPVRPPGTSGRSPSVAAARTV